MLNKVTLVGRATRDPKIMTNENGSKTVLFTVAAQRNFKSQSGDRESDFINVKAFIPANAKSNGPFDYLKKGQLVSVEATLRSSQYEKDGETVYVTDVVLEQNGLSLLDRPKGATTADASAPADEAAPADLAVSEEDLPF